MMTPSATVACPPAFKKASVRDATVLLASAASLPFLVHLLPSWDAFPLGAHLLAMFWVTFVAAYFYGSLVGALTGLASPLVNLLFAGLPAWSMVALLGCELVVFAMVAAALVKRFPRCWLLAPLAVAVSLIAGAGLQTLLAPAGAMHEPVRFLALALTIGWPGLVLLTLINFLLIKRFPKT